MKKLFTIFAIVAGIALTSCNGNADDDQLKYRYVEYGCELSDDWFTYYEISASYSDISGKKANLTMGKGKKIAYSDCLPASGNNVADNFNFTIKAKLKNGVKYDDSTKADFSYETSAKVSEGLTKKSSKAIKKGGEKQKITGTSVSKFVQANPDYTIIDFHCSCSD